MFYPKTLQEAYSLAKLQEALKQGPSGSNMGKGIYGKIQGGIVGAQMVRTMTSGTPELNKNLGTTSFVKKPLNLTPKQIEKKRSKNLCFWCDDKFVPGHKC